MNLQARQQDMNLQARQLESPVTAYVPNHQT